MPIQLWGYNPILQNQVYGRDIRMPQVYGSILKAVVVLERFREATEDDVVSFLREKAKDALRRKSQDFGEELGQFDKTFAKFPKKFLEDLIRGRMDCITFVRQYIGAPWIKEGQPLKEYVHIRYGLIPEETIEYNQSIGIEVNMEFFIAGLLHQQLLEQRLGEKFKLKFLLENGRLSKKQGIDLSIAKRVSESENFFVSAPHYDPREIGELVNVIYAGLPTQREISEIKDMKYKVVEEFAYTTLRRLIETACLYRN